MEEEVKLTGEVETAQNLHVIDNDELLNNMARSTEGSPRFGAGKLIVQPEQSEGRKCDVCDQAWHPLNLCRNYTNRCLKGRDGERKYGV